MSILSRARFFASNLALDYGKKLRPPVLLSPAARALLARKLSCRLQEQGSRLQGVLVSVDKFKNDYAELFAAIEQFAADTEKGLTTHTLSQHDLVARKRQYARLIRQQDRCLRADWRHIKKQIKKL